MMSIQLESFCRKTPPMITPKSPSFHPGSPRRPNAAHGVLELPALAAGAQGVLRLEELLKPLQHPGGQARKS
jgi:hypothetical protein